MVTVLVEKREFEAEPKPAAAQPPAASQPMGDPSCSSADLGPGDRYRQISVFAYYKAEPKRLCTRAYVG
jgi:hypothetical protein